MSLFVNNIPTTLKEQKRWVLWKGVKQGDKVRKLPIQIDGSPASSTDPSTWTDFSTAVSNLQNATGLGYVFNGDGTVGIDLDHCVTNGVINGFANEMLSKVRSYAEFSPSKTGIHIICKAELARAIKTPEIEIYNKGRYFTITGDLIRGRKEIKQVDLSGVTPTSLHGTTPLSIQESLTNMAPGNVDNTLTALAGKLFRQGNDAETVFTLLKPHANEAGHDDTSLMRIVNSVSRYHLPNSNGNSGALGNAVSMDDFLNTEEKVEWIIDGLMGKSSIGFMAGLPESKKTFILMDLAIEGARI